MSYLLSQSLKNNKNNYQLKKQKIKTKDLTLGLNLIQDVRMYDSIYFYEMFPFLYSNFDSKNRIKYCFRITEMKKNMISNDIHTKYFNGLKTMFERNIHLYRFLKKMLAFKPLNIFGIVRKKIADIFIKQNEVNYISGRYNSLPSLILDIDKTARIYQEKSVYNIIPYYSKNIFYKNFTLIKDRIITYSLFIIRSRNRRSLKLFFMGFKFSLKNRKYFRRRAKININYTQKNIYSRVRNKKKKKILRIKIYMKNKKKKKIFLLKNIKNALKNFYKKNSNYKILYTKIKKDV